MAKAFKDLTEREILALAITQEEEDGRIYGDFVDGLRETYPATARVFQAMQEEENLHRAMLIEQYRKRFGEHILLIRRQDVKGFVQRRPEWLVRPLGLNVVRKQAEVMELETRRYYERAIEQISDASTRKLLGDLAEMERKHSDLAESLEEQHLTPEARAQIEAQRSRLAAIETRDFARTPGYRRSICCRLSQGDVDGGWAGTRQFPKRSGLDRNRQAIGA